MDAFEMLIPYKQKGVCFTVKIDSDGYFGAKQHIH